MAKLFVAIFVAALASAPAHALSIEEQAVRCWNVPSAAGTGGDYYVNFEVVFDEDGRVNDITVTDYAPEGELGRQIAISAARAIEACAPYDAPQAGENTLRMDPKSAFPDPIDPFKDNSN